MINAIYNFSSFHSANLNQSKSVKNQVNFGQTSDKQKNIEQQWDKFVVQYKIDRFLIEKYKDSMDASLNRNKHLTKYDGTPFDKTKALVILANFNSFLFDKMKSNPTITVADISDCVDANYKEFCGSIPPEIKLPNAILDAVISDYLNNLAFDKSGSDLAMSAEDLQKIRRMHKN